MTYTLTESGHIVVNGIEYPFTEPTHNVVSGVEVPLTDQQKQQIVDEWISEYERSQAEIVIFEASNGDTQ